MAAQSPGPAGCRQTTNRCTIITAHPLLEEAPFHPGNPRSPALATLANSPPHPKLCGVPPQPLWVHRGGFRDSRTQTFPVDSTLLSSGFSFSFYVQIISFCGGFLFPTCPPSHSLPLPNTAQPLLLMSVLLSHLTQSPLHSNQTISLELRPDPSLPPFKPSLYGWPPASPYLAPPSMRHPFPAHSPEPVWLDSNQAPLLASCVTSGRVLNLSGPFASSAGNAGESAFIMEFQEASALSCRLWGCGGLLLVSSVPPAQPKAYPLQSSPVFAE